MDILKGEKTIIWNAQWKLEMAEKEGKIKKETKNKCNEQRIVTGMADTDLNMSNSCF